jgi:hypothetical protein
VGGRRDDIQAELDQLSANSDVETELHRLRGEIAASAPKQLEVGANGDGLAANGAQGQSQAQPGPYAPPAPTQNPQNAQNPQNPQQTAQSAGIPVSDLPSANDQPQDGEGP